MPDGRHEPADEGGQCAVFLEVFFRLFHFLGVQEAHPSDPALGEFIDDGSAEVLGEVVVDQRANLRPDGREQDYEINVQFPMVGFVGCRGDDNL